MRRRLILLSAALLVLLCGLATAAVVFRVVLAEAMIENRLAALALDSVRLEVNSLGLERARLVALTAGETDELKAQSVALSYDLARLFDGPPLAALDEITIEGLVLRLDLTGRGPPLGSLQRLLEGGGDQAGAAALALPAIILRNARIEAATPLGQAEVALEGTLNSTPDGLLATSLALSAEAGPGRLTGTLSAEGSPDGAASGSLVVDDGRLQVTAMADGPTLAIESLSGVLAFSLKDWRPLTVTGDFVSESLRHPGGAQDSARLSFDLAASSASAEARFAAADGLADASLTLVLDDYRAAPTIEAHLTAEADAGARLLDLLPPPRATAGQGSLDLRIAGRLAPLRAFGQASASALPAPPGLQPLIAWLGQGDLTVETRLELAGLEVPETTRGLAASLAARIAVKGDGVSLELLEAATLSASALAPDWLAGLGVPPDMVETLQDGGRIVIGAVGEPATQLRLADSGAGPALQLSATAQAAPSGQGAFSVSVDAALAGTLEAFMGTAEVAASAEQIEAGGVRLTQAEARLPLAVERRADNLQLSLTAPGRVAAARAARDGVALVRPAATLESGWLRLGLAANGASEPAALEHEVDVRPEPFSLIVPGAQGPIDLDLGPLTLSGGATADAPYEGKARLASGSAALDALAITIDDLGGDAVFDAGFTRATADFAASVTRRDEPAVLVPLALAGRLVREGPALRLKATASPKGAGPEAAALSLPLAARYDLDRGRGEVSLAETTIRFMPDGLQPRHLLPGLADLANVAGEATLAATLALGAEGQRGRQAGTAHLTLRDVSFRSGGNQVNGLDLELALDSLQPPASPPGQRLSIARLESVLPIEDIEAIFQLPATEQPQLRLARLAFRLAGGSFEARDSLLVPGAARQALALEVTGLKLAPLFEALSVQGLTGSGTLDGRLPIALEGNDVAVEGGHLESRAPGTLAYRSASLQSSLPPDADDLALLQSPVDLAILALGNFHYDKLSLALDKAAAGETDLKLHVEGKNPELLDGYPFVFNINLKGNLDPLITALRQGAILSDEMIRRTWKMAP
jgi:hypothetical protein